MGKRVNTPFEYSDDRDPWDRQPMESDQRWAAFSLYLKGGTYQTVGREVGVSWRNVGVWGSEDRWGERRALWQREQERVYREALLAELKEMGKRHANVAKAAFMQIGRPIAALGKPRTIVDPDTGMPRLDAEGHVLRVPRDEELETLSTPRLLDMVRGFAYVLTPLANLERVGLGEPAPPSTEPVADLTSGDEDALVERTAVIMDELAALELAPTPEQLQEVRPEW